MFIQGVYTEALVELIRGLKADGIWDKTELICVVRGSEIASLTNLKNAGERGSNVGCTFTPHRGFSTAESGAKYLDANKVFGGSMGVNSNHLWVYANLFAPVGSWTSQSLFGSLDFSAGGYLYSEVVNAATDTNTMYSGDVGASIALNVVGGFHGVSRTSSTAVEARINSSTSTTAIANTSTSLPSLAPFIGASRSGLGPLLYSDARISGWGWGSGLNTTELGNLRTRVQTYMTAIGAQA